jgi:hypothetical protein
VAFKRWPVVEDSCQLNTTILDRVFVAPCVQEPKDIIENYNKYYCSIDLIQGYHQVLFKVSDWEKTTFITGGLARKLPYCVLPYGLKHG